MKRITRLGWLWKPYHRPVYGLHETPQPANCVTIERKRPDASDYGRWVRVKLMEVEP